jgi:lysophospholipase L1-like esterase
MPRKARDLMYGWRMRPHRLLSLVWVLVATMLPGAGAAQEPPTSMAERFEKKVLEYEAEDRANTPPRGAILFAGDSQFYRWKTIHEDLAGYTLINRGIDSFQLKDLNHYVDRIVTPYLPRLIVLHVGGNDVHNGKSPAQVLEAFKTFVDLVRVKLPTVPIIYSSITPGPGRWDEAPQRVETNRLIREYIATRPGLEFIDLWNAMLAPDGKPREDLWVEDRVHPNHAGYLIRVKLTKPLLGKPDRAVTAAGN